MKDEFKGFPWYRNSRGGVESANDEQHAKNRMRYEERRPNVFGPGHAKGGFQYGGNHMRQKVNNTNVCKLAVLHAQKREIHCFGASLMTLIQWMLESTGYELEMKLIVSGYGKACDFARLECFHALNTNPQANAMNKEVVATVFCGKLDPDEVMRVQDLILVPVWLRVAHIDNMGLADVLILKETGRPPVSTDPRPTRVEGRLTRVEGPPR